MEDRDRTKNMFDDILSPIGDAVKERTSALAVEGITIDVSCRRFTSVMGPRLTDTDDGA